MVTEMLQIKGFWEVRIEKDYKKTAKLLILMICLQPEAVSEPAGIAVVNGEKNI